MSKHRFEVEVEVDDEELAAWVANPRSKDELPIPDVDDWEFRDLVAACDRSIVDRYEAQITNYDCIEEAS
jgi:hypothetical protein